MNINKKVYDYILKNQDILGQNMFTTVEKIFKGINSSLSRKKITQAIGNLVEEGKLSTKGGNIIMNTKVLVGQFRRRLNGTGSVVAVIDGVEKEFFVPTKYVGQTINNSIVNFTIEHADKSEPLARITKVIKSENEFVYGTVIEGDKGFKFMPDDMRFENGIDLVQNEFAKKAVGKRVSVKILNSDKIDERPIGQISDDKQIYGFVNNPMANIASILAEANISTEFEQEVLREVTQLPTRVEKSDLVGRTDFRDLNFITIDPATSKDMDDAVYVEKLYKSGVHVGFKLYVAISDVSNYVKEGSEIDKEAYRRGTSIYPAGGVIPMLPEKLSNGICSLNPYEDRLAMVTVMEIGKNGIIQKYDFHKAVINSKHKFAYEEVSALYANDPEMLDKYFDYKETVDTLYDMESAIAKHSNKKGALRIQGYEPTIILNENKDQVVDFINENNVDSHKVIERAMVANNQVTAEFLNGLGITNLLRVHDLPSNTRFEELVAKLSSHGIDIDGENSNKTYQNILGLIEESPLKKPLYSLAVRSMRKAKYDSNTEIGHFALGLDNYTHFTAPIRRYIDLIEHRLIKKSMALMQQVIDTHKIDTTDKSMSDLIGIVKHYAGKQFEELSHPERIAGAAVQLNKRNEVAEEVSKKSDQACAALYMQNFIGDIKKGYITKIDELGMEITLSDPEDELHSDIIEVFVPMSEVSESSKISVDSKQGIVRSNETQKVIYRVGDTTSVKIAVADANLRMIFATTDLEKELNKTEAHQEVEMSK